MTRDNSDMCVVVARAAITEAADQRVWDLLGAGASGLAPLAEHVLAVAATPDGDQRWSVLLNGSKVDWVQRNRRTGERELAFEQVSGDLAELCGRWTLEPGQLCVTIEFHLGVDGLAPLLDPIWTQSFQAHADALVRAVAGAAGNDAEEREEQA